jgi:hypothetical protein
MTNSTEHYTQTYYEASDGAGNVNRFYVNISSQDAEQRQAAIDFAQNCGYVVKFGRYRLNDYVGSPIWSDSEFIEEI